MLGSQGNSRKLYFSRSSSVSPRVAPSDGAEWNAFSHSRQTASSPLISMPQTPQCLPCCSVCMLLNSSNRRNLAMGPYRVITIILCCCSLPSETLFLRVSLLGIPASLMKMARRYQTGPDRAASHSLCHLLRIAFSSEGPYRSFA